MRRRRMLKGDGGGGAMTLRLLLSLAAVCVMCVAGVGQSETERAVTLRGRLARTVEAGGWLLTTKNEKYLILNANRFQGEPWFRESGEIEATGDLRPGTITSYQEGTPFEARMMRPVAMDAAANAVAGAAALSISRVTVAGGGEVQTRPDTATIVLAVKTQGATPGEAQAANTRVTNVVVAAVEGVAGANSRVRTSDYTLEERTMERRNQPARIVGYDVSNSVRVTIRDLTRIGTVIDAGTKAGANRVEDFRFFLEKDEAAREEALTEATRAALLKAQIIARALGGRVVGVVEVSESGNFSVEGSDNNNNYALANAVGISANGNRGRSSFSEVGGEQQTSATLVQVGDVVAKASVKLVVEIEARPATVSAKREEPTRDGNR